MVNFLLLFALITKVKRVIVVLGGSIGLFMKKPLEYKYFNFADKIFTKPRSPGHCPIRQVRCLSPELSCDWWRVGQSGESNHWRMLPEAIKP